MAHCFRNEVCVCVCAAQEKFNARAELTNWHMLRWLMAAGCTECIVYVAHEDVSHS